MHGVRGEGSRLRLLMAGRTTSTHPGNECGSRFSQARPFAPAFRSPGAAARFPAPGSWELRINLPLVDFMILEFVADERATHCAETTADRGARARGAYRGANNCPRGSTKTAAKKRTLFAVDNGSPAHPTKASTIAATITIAANLFPIASIRDSPQRARSEYASAADS